MSGIGLASDSVRLTEDAPELRVSFAGDHIEAVAQAIAILRREGVVVLDDLLDPALLEACRQELVARYPDYATPDAKRFLGTYPGRHTAPLVIDGLLANRAIFAPPAVVAIGDELLGEEKILESLGLLVSIPGAPDQQRHFDGLLYGETQLDRLLPPVALSVSMPLVRLDEVSGTTAFWRRSHREPVRTGPPDFALVVPVGSVIVWDFRTHHSGRGNQGDAPRPIIFSVHSRNWWQEPDAVKSSHYKKLQVARGVHDAFDKWMRTYTVRAEIVE